MTGTALWWLRVWVLADAQDSTNAEISPGRSRGGTQTEGAMSRKLIWIEEQHFRGFGCSECGWRFQTSGAPTGTSFDEMMRNFELQRDKEFGLHACGYRREARPRGTRTSESQ
jgi:hypothetical protein